jgi:hypothetical protein
MSRTPLALATVLASTIVASARCGSSDDAVTITGEPRQWHKVTLTMEGPASDETATDPNPFLDYRMSVAFSHESGTGSYVVPGYFAADGSAGETSATSGNQWRAHFAPDQAGLWTWQVHFVSGPGVALDPAEPGEVVSPVDGRTGEIRIEPSDKTAPDFRARGRLRYVGRRYLQFEQTGEYFLKLGADAPETLLAYADFDGTVETKPQGPLHTFEPHLGDWREGHPVWQADKGKGLIGAIDYLSSKGVNSMSFLTYNAGGDGDNVWPFVDRDDPLHYDVSKLDQWQVVLDFAQQRGLYLHFKLEETENDDNRLGNPYSGGGRGGGGGGRGGAAVTQDAVPTSLDGGSLGVERKLYLRELVARFGHSLALNWNLGEENTLTTAEQQAMAAYISATDPYDHHIVVHTYPGDSTQEAIYVPLLGDGSVLTGASLQLPFDRVHQRTLRWVTASAEAGRPWVVANDEQGSPNFGVPPDPGYQGFAGLDNQGNEIRSLHDIRKYTLWGNLMAGGAGVEYYFGYQLPDNDLTLENFRSRDRSWDYGRIALEFFRTPGIPFWDTVNADELVGNPGHDNTRYCLASPGELYLVYLPDGGTTSLDLTGAPGSFDVAWFNPRAGGDLSTGSVDVVEGGSVVSLGAPPDSPTEDWLVVVRAR